MRFQEDLGVFFFDFGELVTLQLADGTTRDVTAIWDEPSVQAEDGSYVLDTHEPRLRVRTTDVVGLKWKDSVKRGAKVYDVVRSPEDDGTGLSTVPLGLSENS